MEESERESIIDVTREAPIVTLPDPVAPTVRPPTAPNQSPQAQTQTKFLFRVQPDMKPDKLQRNATLKEINTFITTFTNYNQGIL